MTDSKKATILAAFLAAVMLCACLLPLLIPFTQRILSASPEKNAEGSTGGEPRSVALKQGDFIWFGTYRGERLLWQTAGADDGGRPLLLCDAVICFKAFDVPSASSEQPDAAAFGSSDWESCTLKRWLNAADEPVEEYGETGFLSAENFTAAQRESLAAPGMFVPAKNELKETAQTVSLKKKCRADALASNDYLVLPGQNVWYWTRTPNETSRVSVVTATSSGGFYKTLACDANTGVCPAFFFRSKTVIVTGGDGSRTAPYLVEKGGAAE